MHSPYIKSYEKFNIKYPKEFSSELKHYLDNVHYMDKYLGKYLETIKQQPWYEDCTIIITADHKPNGPKLNTNYEKDFSLLPLIIINPPSEYINNSSYSQTINQTSILPTIIELFRLDSKWKGVGISIWAPDSIRELPYEQERRELQQKTSEFILNENYL